MNDYEITKLKRELQRKQELVKEERQDRQNTQKRLVSVQAERDRFHSELVIARKTIQNVDQIIAQNIKDMKVKLEQQYADSFNEKQRLKEQLTSAKLLKQKLEQENRNKEAVISDLSLRLREMSRKYKDPSLLVNVRQIGDQAAISHNNFYKLTQKYNKVCGDMENVMAQNKILRKIHQIPDNFGFDLEEIKIAEKQELEDYKAQSRKLEAEIEELQAQRTQLRYRLRQYNTLYSNTSSRYKDLTNQQLELLDLYALNLKEGKVELPQIDKTQKQMEREIIRLKAKIEVLQAKASPSYISKGPQPEGQQQLSIDSLRRLQDQIAKLINPIRDDMRRLSQNGVKGGTQNNQFINNNIQQNNTNILGDYRPPMPLPISHNDWSDIKEGYSYMYNSKIPIDLKDIQDETGFNIAKAKYQVAALQLQNMESLKLLRQKQNIENKLMIQINQIRSKYKKCLKMQDQLFVRYFKEKEQVGLRIQQLQVQKNHLTNEKTVLQEQLGITSESLNRVSNKNDVEGRCTQLTAKLSISQADLMKMQRKYQVLNEQHLLLRSTYSNLQTKTASNEFALKEKVNISKQIQRQLVFYLNKIIQQKKDWVAGPVHSATLGRVQMLQDKQVNFSMKETDLRMRINQLQNIQREINLKDDIIDTLREDNFDIILQLEIAKTRLEAADADYRSFQNIFRRFITFINQNNISIMQSLKKFDRDGSGELGKEELLNAIKALGFSFSNNQFEVFFNEFDIDGSQSVSYRQFLRKLRRSGVITHNKDEQGIYRLFRAIKQAGITIRKAFQIIDVDGSNSISKTQMQTAFRTIGIDITSQTVDYIFKICDNDMNNTIDCSQFQKLFQEIVKQSAIEEKEMFNLELDWKYEFIIKIDQISQKYYQGGLKDLFKSIDKDKSACITINQLTQLFTNAGVKLTKKQTLELFEWLDRHRDGKIEFVEFVKILEEAKKETRRIQRLKFAKARRLQLKKQYQIDSQEKSSKLSEERSLQIRLQALQSKHTSFLKKNDRLIKELVSSQQKGKDLKRQIQQLQKSVDKIRQEYYSQKTQLIKLQQNMKNRLPQAESKTIAHQNNNLEITNNQLSGQLDLYKKLYQDIATKNKYDEMRIVKVESQLKKYYEIVKEFQSQSDPKAQLATKIYELQLSKRNQEVVNKKNQQMVQDLRAIQSQNSRLMEDNKDREKQLINAYFHTDQKTEELQKRIDELNNKILPTVNPHKIEEMLMKMREISNSKTQLQRHNRQLQELNFKVQLRNDYLENQKTHIQELQKKLRRTYTDESSQTIMDLTKQLSEYKMGELKAKRQANLLRQKEEYYMRINNANSENITELQRQLANWEKKHNERQQFWRNRLAQQMKMMEDMQKEAAKIKKQQDSANVFFNRQAQKQKDIDQKYQQLPEKRKSMLGQVMGRGGGQESQQTIMKLKNHIQQLQEQLQNKQREIYKLRASLKEIVPDLKLTDFSGGPMSASTNNFVSQTDLTVSQLRNNARRFIDNQKEHQNYYKQQAAKISMAAQHSIDTLQRVIDDKNEQLKRKQHMIENLKREALKGQEEDDRQIQLLMEENRQLRIKAQTNSIQDIMSRPTGKNFYPSGKGDELTSLRKQLQRKDEQIKIMQDKYDKLFISKQKKNNQATDQSKRALERKLDELQQERQVEKKKYVQNQQRLNVKIKNLQKLAKEKQKKLTQLQKTLIDLKDMAVNEGSKIENGEMQQQLEQAIVQMKKGKTANDSKMQMTLQRSINHIHELSKKNKDYQQQVKRLKQDKLAKTAFKR